VRSLSYSGPDNVCQRYAETAKQLCCDRTKEQFVILRKLVPMLRDILQQETNAEAVVDCCYALQHLLDAEDGCTADALIDGDVLPALVSRLDDTKVTVAVHALETLKVFAECSTSEQVLEMEVALGHLQKFIAGSPGQRPNRKLTAEATLCLIPICEGGEQSVQQILDVTPDMFPSLMDLARTQAANQPTAAEIAENCALALMCAVQNASIHQLDYLLRLGVYSLAFRLLDVYPDDADIVKESLRALSNILLKTESPEDLQRREEEDGDEDFQAAQAWESVRTALHFATQVTAGKARASPQYQEQAAYLADKARSLLATAATLGLVQTK
jgi:hypothetical protein